MPRIPIPATNPNGKYNVVTQIPGWLKNDLIQHCAKHNTSINDWLATRILRGIQEDKGLPEPPQAKTPLPTTADQIRAWATGQKLLMPCGKTDCTPIPQEIPGGIYCQECRIRLD